MDQTPSWSDYGQLDAAIDTSNKKMCVGAIVRNYNGNMLASLCSSKPYITDPIVDEAYATWKALKFS